MKADFQSQIQTLTDGDSFRIERMKKGVVACIRERGVHLVQNFVRSLTEQSKQPDVLVIVDFGQKPMELNLSTSFPVILRHLPQGDEWSMPVAMNQGVRLLPEVDTVLFTGIDLIFSPNLIECGERFFEDFPGSFLSCRCFDLAENALAGKPYAAKDFEELRSHATPREEGEVGGCLWLPAKAIHELNGYDEGYRMWGCEDTDLQIRALHHGLMAVQLYPEAVILHQWHPSTRQLRNEDSERGKCFKENFGSNWKRLQDRIKTCQEGTFDPQTVNSQGWGKIP
jgi:hypothetical protein